MQYLLTSALFLALLSPSQVPDTDRGLSALGRAFAAIREAQYKEAVQSFHEACDHKIYPGCSYLASMYVQGLGTESDPVLGRRFHQIACEGQVLVSCYQLAAMLVEGVGGPQDVHRGQTLYQRACGSGFSRACVD